MRQVVIDTETTGLEVKDGHRIIEFACVELESRSRTGRVLHHYVNPDREVERGALEVHGIDNEFLKNKPKFAEVAGELFEFIEGAELIIHNAEFDLGFLDHEFKESKLNYPEIQSVCEVFDTLEVAREKRPGRRNSLNALANEFGIDLSGRSLHGARQDAEILVNVYLALTSGQMALEFGVVSEFEDSMAKTETPKVRTEPVNIVVIRATDSELELHDKILDELDQISENGSIWRSLEKSSSGK